MTPLDWHIPNYLLGILLAGAVAIAWTALQAIGSLGPLRVTRIRMASPPADVSHLLSQKQQHGTTDSGPESSFEGRRQPGLRGDGCTGGGGHV